MGATAPLFLEITLVESGGEIGSAGRPRVVGRFRAVRVPGTAIAERGVSVVAHDDWGGWREFHAEPSEAAVDEVVAMLDALGLPGRVPRVEGVVDTSDEWTSLTLVVGRDDGRNTAPMATTVRMLSSGFWGPDAEPLQRLLRHLFLLAGYDDYRRWVYGDR